jgi:phage terminase large subunit
MTKDLDLQTTWIGTVTLAWLTEPKAPRMLVHKGGTRSGKTYNACIAWADYLTSEGQGETLSLVRATLPALKASILSDMVEVLRAMGLYTEARHNKTDKIIDLPGGARIDYFSTDDEQKVHGRSRDHLWGNEANEIPLPAWRQLVLRTRHRLMLDFNPSFQPGHWINEEYGGSGDAIWYTSTYTDNPHLTDEQRREIESLKEKDPWAWEVYGLGKQARPAAAIYHDVKPLGEWAGGGKPVLGLDFGYNDPMSLCRVRRQDAEGQPRLKVQALLHESHLTTQDLVDTLPELDIDQDEKIICDSAEPDRIEVLQRAGYDARPAKKGKGSVKSGIDLVKQHALRVGGPAGAKARQEFQNYRWRRHRGTDALMDEPEDGDDHAPDAVRYALTELMLGRGGLPDSPQSHVFNPLA